MTCSNCGQENPAGFQFCGRCGDPLVAVAAPPAEERKVVTVLFADVSGSTSLGERLDPERLEQAARPGSVVVSERTARATRGFVFRPLGSLELRGKGRGVPAFELAGERTAAPERGIPGLRAPMVGRDEEVALLRSIYGRAAAEGRPHLVTVFGDAGIGKSRLTAEFMAWAEST